MTNIDFATLWAAEPASKLFGGFPENTPEGGFTIKNGRIYNVDGTDLIAANATIVKKENGDEVPSYVVSFYSASTGKLLSEDDYPEDEDEVFFALNNRLPLDLAGYATKLQDALLKSMGVQVAPSIEANNIVIKDHRWTDLEANIVSVGTLTITAFMHHDDEVFYCVSHTSNKTGEDNARDIECDEFEDVIRLVLDF